MAKKLREETAKSTEKEVQNATSDEKVNNADSDATVEEMLNALKGKREEMDRRRKTSMMKLEQGANKVRILPPKKGKKLFFEEIFSHYSRKAGRGTLCNKMFKEACYFCDKQKSLWSTDIETAKRMYARPRYVMAAIDLSNIADGTRILVVPKTVFDEISAISLNPEWGLVCDSKNGFDLTITRKVDNRYSVTPSRKSSAIPQEWLEDIPELTNVFDKDSYEDQRSLYEGIPGEDREQIGEIAQNGKSNEMPSCFKNFGKENVCSGEEKCEWKNECFLSTQNADVKDIPF